MGLGDGRIVWSSIRRWVTLSPSILRLIIKPRLNFLPRIFLPIAHRTDISKAVILGGGWRLELWQKDLGWNNGVGSWTDRSELDPMVVEIDPVQGLQVGEGEEFFECRHLRLEFPVEGGDAKAFVWSAHLKRLVTKGVVPPAHGPPLKGMIGTSVTVEQGLVVKRVLEEQPDILDKGDDG